jgi:ABC-type Fe3+/spermidine/putrescine transport system ATPase subunit
VTATLVRLTDVAKKYGARGGGIRDVSFTVAAGECVALVGPSGSGKTTLLRLIAGLERPDRGGIWLDGREMSSGSTILVPAYERRIGFVFQDLALWPHLTVRGNLDFVVAAAALPRAQRARRIDDTLVLCRVPPQLADRLPHQLSGGEQQRVALARALVGSPRLLLLDEPFATLDRPLRVPLRSELAALQREIGLTTICVTHDSEDAAALAGRTLSLRDGRLEDD